jgi:RNA polymerase sigma-70 factor (ECF subfamily)
MDGFSQDSLAAAFAENRQRLISLAEKRLNPILLKRMSAEDILSETYVNATKRLKYFAAHDDVPIYYKLRTILLQTLADIERRHLQAQGRDAYKELRVESEECKVDGSGGDVCVGELQADITSPASRVDRGERHAILRRALAAMPENDRAILVMRHFDGLGNSECASALGLTEKAASIRYVRALERLQQKLVEVSCFRKN